MNYFLFIIIILKCLSTTSCVKEKLKDYSTHPEKIISLAPSITKQLYELGISSNIIGVTSFCKNKPQNAEIVGNLISFDNEKIIKLKPDLVIATKEGNPKEVIENLEKLGINIFIMDNINNFNDIKTNFINLGRKTGTEKEAIEIIKKIENELKKMTKSYLRKKSKTKVFFQIGINPLITTGKNTYIDEIINFAGGENIVNISKIRFPQYSIEDVIKQNPDIIITLEMDGSNVSSDFWLNYKTINAVKNRNIYSVDPDIFCQPTPENFFNSVKILNNYLKMIDSENK